MASATNPPEPGKAPKPNFRTEPVVIGPADLSRANENVVIHRNSDGTRLWLCFATSTTRVEVHAGELVQEPAGHDSFGRPIDRAGRVIRKAEHGERFIERGNRIHIWSDKRSFFRDVCKGRVRYAPSKARVKEESLYLSMATAAEGIGGDPASLPQSGYVAWDVDPDKLCDAAELYLGERPPRSERWQDHLQVLYLLATHERTAYTSFGACKWKPYPNGLAELEVIFEHRLGGLDIERLIREVVRQQQARRQRRKPLRESASGPRCFACGDHATDQIDGQHGIKLPACDDCRSEWQR